MSALSSRLSFCRTVGTGTTLRKAAIHRDRPDRRRSPFLFYAIRAPAEPLLHARLTADKPVISDVSEITKLCSPATGRPKHSVRHDQLAGAVAAARTSSRL